MMTLSLSTHTVNTTRVLVILTLFILKFNGGGTNIKYKILATFTLN